MSSKKVLWKQEVPSLKTIDVSLIVDDDIGNRQTIRGNDFHGDSNSVKFHASDMEELIKKIQVAHSNFETDSNLAKTVEFPTVETIKPLSKYESQLPQADSPDKNRDESINIGSSFGLPTNILQHPTSTDHPCSVLSAWYLSDGIPDFSKVSNTNKRKYYTDKADNTDMNVKSKVQNNIQNIHIQESIEINTIDNTQISHTNFVTNNNDNTLQPVIAVEKTKKSNDIICTQLLVENIKKEQDSQQKLQQLILNQIIKNV